MSVPHCGAEAVLFLRPPLPTTSDRRGRAAAEKEEQGTFEGASTHDGIPHDVNVALELLLLDVGELVVVEVELEVGGIVPAT